MLQSIFISAHPAGNCQLILGHRSAVLIDCTVAFCAPETVANIKNALDARPLEAIILSHSHYDHATGLPWLRQAFPTVPVYAHPYVQEVFSKPGALATIRKMCTNAQMLYGNSFTSGDYTDEQLQITHPLSDGQTLPFDDGCLRIIFTPGHTKDSVSIDFPDEKVTWLCETIGVLRPDGRVQPCFLSSYADTQAAITRIANLGERRYAISHEAQTLSVAQSVNFLEQAAASVNDSAELILRLFNAGEDADGIFKGYEAVYWNALYRPVWPYEAFRINTIAAIKTVLREHFGQMDF